MNPFARPSPLAFLILLAGILGAPAFGASATAVAQSYSFRARLSPAPINGVTVGSITGIGLLRATLDGNQLTVTGSYRGMSSPATAAHIHSGPPGIPGPLAHPLEVTSAADGEINGSVGLTDDEITALREQALYVQIHSQGNPAGELRG